MKCRFYSSWVVLTGGLLLLAAGCGPTKGVLSKKHRVKLQIHYPPGKTGSADADIEYAQEIWGEKNLDIQIVDHTTSGDAALLGTGNNRMEIDQIGIEETSQELFNFVAQHRTASDTIGVYVVHDLWVYRKWPPLGTIGWGEVQGIYVSSVPGALSGVIFIDSDRSPRTLSHEMWHLLTRDPDHAVNTGLGEMEGSTDTHLTQQHAKDIEANVSGKVEIIE